jgi:hypothetical protein
MRFPRLRCSGSAVAVVLILIGATAPIAQAAESISDYSVSFDVTPEALLRVTEDITYDFDGQPDRHGIQRDLVLEDELDDGSTQVYGVEISSVTANGAPVEFTTSDNGSFLSVRIGDPDITVSGTVEYSIAYSVSGSLRALTAEEASATGLSEGDIEFYWDAIGDGWGVTIDSATVAVRAPREALAAACYVGAAGGTDECAIYTDAGALVTDPVALGPNESVTIVAAYPSSAFSIVPAPTIEPPFEIPGYAWIITLLISALAVLLPIGFVLTSRRRLRGAALSGAPVQFEAPDAARPAELQAAIEGEVDARGAVATLLDLTARGHLTLAAEEGGFLQKDSITITRTRASTDALVPWEAVFLDGLMDGRDSTTIAGYDAALARTLTTTSATLVSDAESLNRRTRMRNRGLQFGLLAVGVGGLALSLLVLIAFSDGSGFLALIPGALLLISCVIAMALVPARETPESASFQSRAEGFRKLLDTDAATARREFAQRSGLPPFAIFATLLPYAVIFNLEGSWTQAFPDITREQLNAGGYYFASALAMQGFISSSESAMVLASTEPGRDSGSGFSGGFSGGGGGGGGGGSW